MASMNEIGYGLRRAADFVSGRIPDAIRPPEQPTTSKSEPIEIFPTPTNITDEQILLIMERTKPEREFSENLRNGLPVRAALEESARLTLEINNLKKKEQKPTLGQAAKRIVKGAFTPVQK